MLIMSQDGLKLIEPKLLRVTAYIGEEKRYIYASAGTDEYIIGEYASEEAAKEVLKDIAACIGKGVTIFWMP